jgi:hypothetical protein
VNWVETNKPPTRLSHFETTFFFCSGQFKSQPPSSIYGSACQLLRLNFISGGFFPAIPDPAGLIHTQAKSGSEVHSLQHLDPSKKSYEMPQQLSSKDSSLFRQVVRHYENKQYKKGSLTPFRPL